MEKQNFEFTKDYLEAIASAGLYSYQHNTNIIESDELFFGIYSFTQKYDFHEVFWQFFGVKNPTLINDYIVQLYQRDAWKLPGKKDKLHFQLSESFKKDFVALQKKGVSSLNVLSLLYMSLDLLSTQFKHYLQQHKVKVPTMRKKALHALEMIQKSGVPAMQFFEMFDSMIDELGGMMQDAGLDLDFDKMMLVDATSGDVIMGDDASVKDPEDKENDEKDDKKKKKGEKDKMTIEYFGTNLTNEAKDGKLDPVIGRDSEIQQVIYTLLRKTKNNPLLLGEAGVGKTAIIEGLAQKIIAGDVPERLKGKHIYMVDVGALIAGTKYRGEFEARLKAIVEEASDPTNNIIMFIDEVHTIIGAGSAEGTSDAANMLKPLLARGKLQLIGATTFDEYQKYIEKDPALKRRFQDLMVNEPSRDDAILILKGIQQRFEDFHGVRIQEQAITKAVDYSIRYMMNKYLPDKAIDIIDEACARMSTLHKKLDNDTAYKGVETKLNAVIKKLEKAIAKQDYFAAAGLKEQEDSLKEELKKLRSMSSLPQHLRPEVGVDNIGQVLADKMGIPVVQVTENEIVKLAGLQKHLTSLIFGQDEAVEAVVKAIKRSRISVVESQKPIASFLFLGPTGVGKTYLAKLIAKEYFGDEKSMIRVDMSEYMERFSTSKLIGSAPGYVGYEEGGALTEQVRRKPYSVVLFDEIEKASPDVLNVMLQILDEGHLKDNKGRWIDFKNTIIIMTSNLGSEYFGEKMTTLGFGLGNADKKEEEHFDSIKEKVLEEVKEFMAPELINRLSAQIVFKPLTKALMGDIFKKEVGIFLDQWKTKTGLKLPKFTPKKIDEVVEKIYDAQYGARPIYRYIHDEVEPDLIEQVIAMEVAKK